MIHLGTDLLCVVEPVTFSHLNIRDSSHLPVLWFFSYPPSINPHGWLRLLPCPQLSPAIIKTRFNCHAVTSFTHYSALH